VNAPACRSAFTTLDLFSGIGGFALGLERTGGFKTTAFCEINPFARRVLARHWPEVPAYDDVRSVTAARLAADGIIPDVVCGGFPCQDISVAGRGAGLEGERSGLWHEMLRVIAETRPRYVIAENVAMLRNRGLDTCLRGLAEIGYDAEWHIISAAALGAPHKRERVWIVAYPAPGGRGINGHERGTDGNPATGQSANGGAGMADASGTGLPRAEQPGRREPIVTAADLGRAVAECRWRRAESRVGGIADGVSRGTYGGRGVEPWEGATPRTVGRGYPDRRARLMALGNAVVPLIPQLIGWAIMRAEGIAA